MFSFYRGLSDGMTYCIIKLTLLWTPGVTDRGAIAPICTCMRGTQREKHILDLVKGDRGSKKSRSLVLFDVRRRE